MSASTGMQRTRVQAAWEMRLLLRNGEQLLLTIVIPIAILLVLALTDLLPSSRSGDVLPVALATVLTVSIISSAFTSLAIATAFERRSGALRLLSTTPLSVRELLAAKLLATVGVTALSAIAVVAVSVILGWRPGPGTAWAIPVLALGVAAWVPWGLALAGALRAEAVLAVANGLFLAFLLFGGVVIPASSLPAALATVTSALPSGALAEALTAALADGSPNGVAFLVLAAWAAIGSLVAARTFRWA